MDIDVFTPYEEELEEYFKKSIRHHDRGLDLIEDCLLTVEKQPENYNLRGLLMITIIIAIIHSPYDLRKTARNHPIKGLNYRTLEEAVESMIYTLHPLRNNIKNEYEWKFLWIANWVTTSKSKIGHKRMVQYLENVMPILRDAKDDKKENDDYYEILERYLKEHQDNER